MNVPYFETKLRELIIEADEKRNLYHYMGWKTDWIEELRHLYLKTLLKIQLRNFSHD